MAQIAARSSSDKRPCLDWQLQYHGIERRRQDYSASVVVSADNFTEERGMQHTRHVLSLATGYFGLTATAPRFSVQVHAGREDNNSIAIELNYSSSSWAKTFADPMLCDRCP